ncbi:MAG: hypothetical protein J0L94_06055 [Rhodothermia bacterium]|nr:hypothetical protein [Rhodothermia bacterium]
MTNLGARTVDNIALELLQTVLPPPKGIRLIGIRLSNLTTKKIWMGNSFYCLSIHERGHALSI